MRLHSVAQLDKYCRFRLYTVREEKVFWAGSFLLRRDDALLTNWSASAIVTPFYCCVPTRLNNSSLSRTLLGIKSTVVVFVRYMVRENERAFG